MQELRPKKLQDHIQSAFSRRNSRLEIDTNSIPLHLNQRVRSLFQVQHWVQLKVSVGTRMWSCMYELVTRGNSKVLSNWTDIKLAYCQVNMHAFVLKLKCLPAILEWKLPWQACNLSSWWPQQWWPGQTSSYIESESTPTKVSNCDTSQLRNQNIIISINILRIVVQMAKTHVNAT